MATSRIKEAAKKHLKAARSIARPVCNCEHWKAVAAAGQHSVTFICPVHGCATLTSGFVLVPSAPPAPKPPTPYTDARSTQSIPAPTRQRHTIK